MDDIKSQNMEQQVTEEAVSKIMEIRYTGKAKRKLIQDLKQDTTMTIEKCIKAGRLDDAVKSSQREELLKQLGVAAATGDASEMKRIKDILDSN